MQTATVTDNPRAEIDRQRRAMIEALAAIPQTLEKVTLPRMDAEIKTAERALEEAKAASLRAMERLNAANKARPEAVLAARADMERVRQQLRATSPECISRFVQSCKDDLKATEQRINGDPHLIPLHSIAALRVRADRLRTMVIEDVFDSIRLSCVDEADAMERIEEFNKTLPGGGI